MKNIRLVTFALIMIFLLSLAASAKDNSISLFGSYGHTYMGVEYERRVSDFGLGAELGFLPIFPDSYVLRISAIGRYYIPVKSSIRPYISLYPGLLIISAEMPTSMSYPSQYLSLTNFSIYATMGAEYKVNSFRAALEIGGGLAVLPLGITSGKFIVKGAIGVAF